MLERDNFQPTFDRYPINKTISDIVEICQLQAEMQKVTINLIELPKEEILEIDLFRMQQVVINLLSNALKFSKAMDVIDVRLGLTAIGYNGEVELKIDVKDKGIGIAAHEQELIFEPFYRSPNTNSYGHGIGLSICRRLM
jgi:signal transduction histidine kinase